MELPGRRTSPGFLVWLDRFSYQPLRDRQSKVTDHLILCGLGAESRKLFRFGFYHLADDVEQDRWLEGFLEERIEVLADLSDRPVL